MLLGISKGQLGGHAFDLDLFCVLNLYSSQDGHSVNSREEEGAAPRSSCSKNFDLSELKAATQNFSDENVISESASCTVYKRTSLPMRAVKATREAEKYKQVEDKIQLYLSVFSLRNDIDMLHRLDGIENHVLAIADAVGAVPSMPGGSRSQPQLEGAEAGGLRRHVRTTAAHRSAKVEGGGGRMVVSDYVPYGSFYDHLHSSPSSSPVAALLKKRVEVLMSVAHDIQWMHRYSRPSVVHGHIASSNILLDGASVTCRPARNTGVAGYVNPESRHTGRRTTASDVYSFGVVILEAVTGMRPFVGTRDGRGRKEVVGGLATLPRYVRRFIKAGELRKVLDWRPEQEPTPRQLEALGLLVHAAMSCV